MKLLFFSNNIAQYIIAIIALDIILGPVIPPLSLQASIFLCVFIVAVNLRLSLENFRASIAIFMVGVLASTLYGILVSPEIVDGYTSVNQENLKRVFYLFLAFFIYQAFILCSFKINDNGKFLLARVLLFSCLVYIIFAAIFKYDFILFNSLKSLFFSVDVDMSQVDELIYSGYLARYSFILLDPNNSGYFMLMISIFLIENLNTSKSYKFIAWFTIFLNPFLCLSGGVIYAIIIYLSLKFLPAIKKSILYLIKFNKIKKNSLPLIFFLFITISLVILFSEKLFPLLSSTDLFLRLIDDSHRESTQGRYDKYWYVFEHGFPHIIGSGYLIFIDGQLFKPHSDHLRFICSYGVLTYISLFFIVVRKDIFRKEYLFLVPALSAFTFNSLIDETRILFTFALLFALARSKQLQIKT